MKDLATILHPITHMTQRHSKNKERGIIQTQENADIWSYVLSSVCHWLSMTYLNSI